MIDLKKIHEDKRGIIWKLSYNNKDYFISFTRKGYARGGDIHNGKQYNAILYGNLLVKEKYDVDIESILKGGDFIVINKNVPHVFIALKDSLMLEWHEYRLGEYENKRFYKPYRELCK